MAVVDTSLKDLPSKVARMLMDQADAETELGQTFDWGSVDHIPCVVTDVWEGKELDIGGWVKLRKAKVKFRTVNDVIPEGVGRPAENDQVLVRMSAADDAPIRYRVKGIRNFYNALLWLECEQPMQ